jgi:hypothetical protein
MIFRRPRKSTLISVVVFLISFVFWLGQPQTPKPILQMPAVSWVFVTTTDVPKPVDTLPPLVEATLPPDTLIPVDTVPTEVTLDPEVTTVAP